MGTSGCALQGEALHRCVSLPHRSYKAFTLCPDFASLNALPPQALYCDLKKEHQTIVLGHILFKLIYKLALNMCLKESILK